MDGSVAHFAIVLSALSLELLSPHTHTDPGIELMELLAIGRELCAEVLANASEQRIEARKNRVYLDSFRNGFGATVVAPYSVRRRPKASFSMPLRWDEVKSGLDPAKFNLGNYKKRLAGGDAWEGFFESRQSLKGRASA